MFPWKLEITHVVMQIQIFFGSSISQCFQHYKAAVL